MSALKINITVTVVVSHPLAIYRFSLSSEFWPWRTITVHPPPQQQAKRLTWLQFESQLEEHAMSKHG